MSVERVTSAYVSQTGRCMYFMKDLDHYTAHGVTARATPLRIAPQSDLSHLDVANLVSSETHDGKQLPVIDCDYPIQAVPSSTTGHYHLYIDKELSWVQYKSLLDGLYGAGLIQEAWYYNALQERRSYVRLPHVKKAS